MASKKKSAKPALRLPKTFTAKVTDAIFNASMKRKEKGKSWAILNDCPVAVAARRALKRDRWQVTVSRVDVAVYNHKSHSSRRYTHDGAELVKAFDSKSEITLPQTVTFTLEPKEEF